MRLIRIMRPRGHLSFNNGVRHRTQSNCAIVEGNDSAVALFHGTDLSMLTVRALKVWLGSQGASTRRNKAALEENDYVLIT